MARAVSTDFFQNMYFLVTATRPDGLNMLNRTALSGVNAPAGFQSCTVPSVSTDPVEYREGTFIYTRKYPGIPSMDQITLNRGVARLDSAFFAWMRLVNEGSGDYRADVQIKHFHRGVSLTRPFPTTGGPATNRTFIDEQAQPGRIYHVAEAFPSMVKLAGDLDGTSSDVSLQEIQLEYEYVEIEEFDF